MAEKECRFCGGSPDRKFRDTFICNGCAGVRDETLGPDPYSTVYTGVFEPDIVPGEVIGMCPIEPSQDFDFVPSGHGAWLIAWPMNVACNYELDMAGDVTVVCPKCGRHVNWYDDDECSCGWKVPESWKRMIDAGTVTFKYEDWEHRHDPDAPQTFTVEHSIPAEVEEVIETLIAPWDDERQQASHWMALRQLIGLCLKSSCGAWRVARDFELDVMSEGRQPDLYWERISEIVNDYRIMQSILKEVIRCREDGSR